MNTQLSVEETIPKLMYLLKFRGTLTVEDMYKCTGYGKATIRNALISMIKNGLIKKKGTPLTYELSNNSKYWLGWRKEQGWATIKQ